MELHKTMEEALTLNAYNGNSLWPDAIQKETETLKWHLKFHQTRQMLS